MYYSITHINVIGRQHTTYIPREKNTDQNILNYFQSIPDSIFF